VIVCNLLGRFQRLGGNCRLHLQDEKSDAVCSGRSLPMFTENMAVDCKFALLTRESVSITSGLSG
jgi:hypothetical protein